MMKWALVLSGGGARGLAHVGALKALESWELRPGIVVGSSIGALVGACYACGVSVREMEEFLAWELDLRRYLDRRTLPAFGGPLAGWLGRGRAAWRLLRRQGMDSGRRLHLLYRRLTGDRDFGETRIPFACNAVDLLSGREVVLDRGRLADALRATTSIPGLFTPVPCDGMLLVDGGVLDSAPVWIARQMGARRVLCLQVNRAREVTGESLTSGLSVYLRAAAITSAALQARPPQPGVLEIRAWDGTGTLDFSRRADLIRLGEEAVRQREAEIRRFLGGRSPAAGTRRAGGPSRATRSRRAGRRPRAAARLPAGGGKRPPGREPLPRPPRGR